MSNKSVAGCIPLKQVEEAFSDGVVMAVATAVHRVLQIVGLQERGPVHADELRPMIRVDQRQCRTARMWVTRRVRISAANIGPKRFHHGRTVS